MEEGAEYVALMRKFPKTVKCRMVRTIGDQLRSNVNYTPLKYLGTFGQGGGTPSPYTCLLLDPQIENLNFTNFFHS